MQKTKFGLASAVPLAAALAGGLLMSAAPALAADGFYKGKVFKNPSFKPFDFEERFEKIKHPIPD